MSDNELRERCAADPDRAKVYTLLCSALRTGEITRPDKCSRCGVACVPHGHHGDYSKPLDVVWLCPKCHGYVHRKARVEKSLRGVGCLVVGQEGAMEPILLKIDEVAKYIGLNHRTIRRMADRGELPVVRIGKSLRFKTEEVRKFVEDLRAENARG